MKKWIDDMAWSAWDVVLVWTASASLLAIIFFVIWLGWMAFQFSPVLLLALIGIPFMALAIRGAML